MAGASVTVAGNLTAAPELRYTQNGVAVASFTVAHTKRRRDPQTNEWRDVGETLFLRCSAWRELGENAAASLSKGDKVIVTGELEQRSYDTSEGEKRTVVECRVDVVAVDLRGQTVATVMRIRKGGMPEPDTGDAWGAPEPSDAPATRRSASAA